ncbi:hypothetical protein [Actinoplanes sp. NPDC051411]|uniref:hypothetical protein n=1 Tax=Actinoplanes sp. NPDC051411 TaxID=3155522 RepID=UPI00343C40EE
MPQRRLAGLTLAMVAAAALAACEIKVDPASMPAPFSQAPVPSASTGQPAYVCTTVYQILTSGAAELSDSIGGRSAAARQATQRTLADMATRISAEGAKTADPGLRQATDDIATELTAASKQPDPSSYIDGGFTTISRKLDGHCD